MQTIFDRIHTQFARLKEKYQSDIDLSFNDGATDDDFDKLESVLGFELPNDFKEIYRIHNGSDNWFVLMGDDWLSVDGIIDDYQVWKRLYDERVFTDENDMDFGCEPNNPEIKSDYWVNPKWIPFTQNGCGDNKMIDLDPTSSGTVGQIVQMWHDDASRELLATSLKDFFEQFAQALENDEYVIHPRQRFVRRDELDYHELEELKLFE